MRDVVRDKGMRERRKNNNEILDNERRDKPQRTNQGNAK